MYEIRFYYKNKDINCKAKVVYHLYNRYETFEEAYEEITFLINLYENMGVKEVVFMPSILMDMLESHVLSSDEKGIDSVATIVKNEKISQMQ